MKKWLQVLGLGAILGVSLPVLYYGGLIGVYAFSVVFGRDTAYAPGFSEEKFRRIHPGMARREVEGLVGTGFWTSADRSAVGYSRSPTGTHYDDRRVLYVDDRVTEVISEIYFD